MYVLTHTNFHGQNSTPKQNRAWKLRKHKIQSPSCPSGFFPQQLATGLNDDAKHTTQNKEKKGPIMLDSACTTNALNWLIPKRRGHFHLKLKQKHLFQKSTIEKNSIIWIFVCSYPSEISSPNPTPSERNGEETPLARRVGHCYHEGLHLGSASVMRT